MLLVITVLGLIAVLMREYSDVSRFTDAKERTLDGIQFALAEIAHEVGSSVRLSAPTGTSGPTLSFRRFDPAVERFNLPEVNPDPDIPLEWNPRNLTTETMFVTYRRELNGELVRTLVRASGATSQQVMAPQVASFNVTKLDADYLQLSLGFQEQLRLRTFTMQAKIWPKP